MTLKKTEENQQVENETGENGMSKEDALLITEIVRKALEHRPFIKEGLFRERYLALSDEQKMTEFNTPRVSIFYPGENRDVPALFFRLMSDEGPLTEAFFYPYEAVWSFLIEARNFVNRNRGDDMPQEQIETLVFNYAVEMTLLMFDNLYSRTMLYMNSFTEETIAQWYFDLDHDMARYYSERGELAQRPKIAGLDRALKSYLTDVRSMWKYQGQTRENWRKLQFADEYEAVYSHWRKLMRWVNDCDRDWRDYAKAGSFDDTPDDLIKKLENSDRLNAESVENNVSELALEHAARRTGLIKNQGVSEWARQMRQKGLKVSDYSIPQLFVFLKEGKELRETVEKNRKIQEQLATYPTPETDSTIEKKRKSLEQKLNYIREKSPNKGESKPDLAMEKKA